MTLIKSRQMLAHVYAILVSTFISIVFCPRMCVGLKRLGSLYGGWWVCASLLRPDSFALCCGAGEDISFDIALNSAYGLNIVCVDPTPRAVKHVTHVLEAAMSGNTQEVALAERPFMAGFDSRRFSFVPHAIWSSDMLLRLYEPEDPTHVSHSALNLQNTERYIEVPAETPASIVSRLGIQRLSLIKLDIEGAEYEVLSSIIETGLRPEQLLLEFDEFHHSLSLFYPWRVIGWIRKLRHAGYRLVHVERCNFLFQLSQCREHLTMAAL